MIPTALSTQLAALVAADPDRPAVTCGDETLSRADLDRRTNTLARAYAARGVAAGSMVTITLPNGVEGVTAAVAVWKLGAVPQPLSPRLPAHELAALLDLARPALVVGADPGTTGGLPAVPAGFVPDVVDDSALPPAVGPSWKAPTSGGSTGRPKLIVAAQPACAEVVLGYAQLFRMPTDGVHLVTGPMYHNAGFMFATCALFSGNHVVVMPRFDPAEMLRLVDAHRADWVFVVPTMMHRVSRLPAGVRESYDLSSLRLLLHSAAPCPGWLKENWIGWLGPDRVFEMYASTEAMAGSLITGEEWLTHRGSVGRMVVGEVSIRDADGSAVPPGTTGEIWLRTAADAPSTYHYVGAEARTRPGGWESQGDCGWVDEEGYLYVADRLPDMILVGGANVYPAEVEAALDEHPAVRSSCVVGLPDEEYGSTVHAIVQADDPLDADALLAHLRERLAPYKLPRTFERVDHPLRDDAGKVRRSRLRAERLERRPVA